MRRATDKIAVFLGGTYAHNRNQRLLWSERRRARETSRAANIYNQTNRQAMEIVKYIRRMFSKTLGPFHGFSVEYEGRGWDLNYSTGRILFYLHYRAYRDGMKFERSARIRCAEDVKAEAWRLWSSLDVWKRFDVERAAHAKA